MAGKLFVKAIVEREGYKVIGEEVKLVTEGGSDGGTRADLLASKDGLLKSIEAKNLGGRLTPNQKQDFPLMNSGAASRAYGANAVEAGLPTNFPLRIGAEIRRVNVKTIPANDDWRTDIPANDNGALLVRPIVRF